MRFLLVIFLALVICFTNCKVSEESVKGSYQTKTESKLILYSDSFCRIDIGYVTDTVIGRFSSPLTILAKWYLHKDFVQLKVSDPKHKAWELQLKAKRNKLVCSNCSLNYNKVTLLLDPETNSTEAKRPNRTISDIEFYQGDIIRIPTILYSLDGNGSENDDSLKIIAAFIKSHNNLIFSINSHSDSRGSAEKNLLLTKNRAESVKSFLIEKFNIDSTQIRSKGYGEFKTIIYDTKINLAGTKEKKESLHQINRRTELEVIGKR